MKTLIFSLLLFMLFQHQHYFLHANDKNEESTERSRFPPLGFTSLFNGFDLDGWWGCKGENPQDWMSLPAIEFHEKWSSSLNDIEEHWRVENGELVNDGEGLFLTTEKNYDDFELMLEYKTVAGADSGIYLRGIPQVQIWDTTKEGGKWELGAQKGSGGLWNNGSSGVPGRDPLFHADNPFGVWNKVHITMRGDLVSVLLNDQLVVNQAPLNNFWDRKSPKNIRKPIIEKGPIQLQTHGGEIRWRNLFIKELPPSCCEAPEEIGYNRLFNGFDLTGWLGAEESYEVFDGAIVCKKGKGGTLYTKEKFGDFSLRLAFKLPSGGNNGLAIRYPGQGNPAYDGMCELQVLDNKNALYAKLDPRQFHGSAYGLVPAKKGFLREVGKWNEQEVIVIGSRVTLILNSEVILNADLSKVENYMNGKAHPGLSLSEGHLGLAGHKDPVAFREIRIKEYNF